VGVLKPAVIVPETVVRELDEERLAVVYAHELAHHARRDVLIGYLQALLEVIWWFHPLFHILSRRVNELREDCVDDQILGRRFSSDDQYCALLLDAAGYATTSLAIGSSGMAAGLHPLHRRIRRIMTGETFNALPFSRRTIAAIVLAAVLSLPGFVPDRDHSRSPSPSPSPSPSESPSDSPSP
jgi:beta-lactamase regulating signal transducer with metallopeptidase domain